MAVGVLINMHGCGDVAVLVKIAVGVVVNMGCERAMLVEDMAAVVLYYRHGCGHACSSKWLRCNVGVFIDK